MNNQERLDKISSLLIEVQEIWGRTYGLMKEVRNLLDEVKKNPPPPVKRPSNNREM